MRKTITSLKLCLLLTVCFFFGRQSQAQTMSAGDIAFVGYTTSAPDAFSFIFLNPVSAGEQIFFTDMGWAGQSYGWMTTQTAEVHLKYTVPAGGHACGTIVSIVESTTTPDLMTVTVSSGTAGTLTFAQNTGFNLSAGDQIIAYQSSTNLPMVASPKFISAINGDYTSTNYNSTTGWSNEFPNSTAWNTGESALPVSSNGSLTTGTDCISLYQGVTEVANAKFNLTLSGSTSTLRGQINSPSNWVKASTNYSIIPSSYTTGAITCCTAAAITGQPSNSTVCSGASTSFSVTATDVSTYQWQVNTGSGFGNITNGGVYSGATSATLNISNTAGMSGYSYRLNATGACGSPATSNAVTLTVNAAPSVLSSPSASGICAGGNTSFTASVNNATGYQWQENTGAGYSSIANGGVYSGATTATLTLTGVTSGMNGNSYRCIATGSCSPNATTSGAILTVNAAPSIGTQPSAQSACAGANTSFTVVASNATGYQWKVSTTGTGGTFTNITNGGVYSNATTATLNITGATTGMNGYAYQCVITGGCSPAATSNAVVLTVNSAPAITQNPFSSAVCESDATLFYISASNATSYQWQVNKNDGSGFTNVSNGAGPTGGTYSGATNAVLIINDAAVAMSGYTYRCVASGSCSPSATSTAATLTVYANVTYYEDWDNDGYGNIAITSTTCSGAPGGFVSNFDDCDDNDPNIYPGAVEICYDGIDNNCDGNIDEGCVPLTQLSASDCGTTLEYLNTQYISADPVIGAEQYEFRITNGAYVATATDNLQAGKVRIIQFAGYSYGTTYEVAVRAKVGGVWGIFNSECQVTTTGAPHSELDPAQCNTTLPAMNTTIYTSTVNGATQYRFRIINGANVQTIDRPVRSFNMTMLANYEYNTTYTIDVAVEFDGTWWAYSTACNITTPALGTSVVLPTQCGTTLAAVSSSIFSSQVSGATQYRYRVTNGASVQTIDKPSASFKLTELASYAFSTTYTIDVAVEYNGMWQAYGSACTVTTPAIALTQVQASQCGASLASMTTYIYANSVSGATQYRFRFTEGANTQTYVSATRAMNVTMLATHKANTTYSVEVAAMLNGTWGAYGPVCTVTTPSVPTKIQSSQCSTTLSKLDKLIYADVVNLATTYRFRITNGANVQTIDRTTNSFYLTQLASYAYGTTYSIDVAVQYGGVWQPYGSACNISTPAAGSVTTTLISTSCGIVVSANTQSLVADKVVGATQYEFLVENAGLSYSQSVVNNTFTFSLSQLTGITNTTTYTVKVRTKVNNIWSPYGAACNVGSEGTWARPGSSATEGTIAAGAFDAVTFPNPFSGVFGVKVSTPSTETIYVTVYDMSGKVLESHTAAPEEIRNLNMGEGFAAGIYQVRVVQGTETKTLKVVKQ